MVTKEYADPFDNSFWAELEDIDCPCQGNGWANIDEKWNECPIHFCGQLHPMSRDLLLDEPKKLAEAQRVSLLNWKIEKGKEEVRQLQVQLKQAQYSLHLFELDLINKTPTIRMESVTIPLNSYPTVQMKAVRLEDPMVEYKEVPFDDFDLLDKSLDEAL